MKYLTIETSEFTRNSTVRILEKDDEDRLHKETVAEVKGIYLGESERNKYAVLFAHSRRMYHFLKKNKAQLSDEAKSLVNSMEDILHEIGTKEFKEALKGGDMYDEIRGL